MSHDDRFFFNGKVLVYENTCNAQKNISITDCRMLTILLKHQTNFTSWQIF